MSTASNSPPRRGRRLWPWLLLLLLGASACAGWLWWQARQDNRRAAASDIELRLQSLDDRLAALRDDRRAQSRRLQQAEAGNRIVREQLLGLGQRVALIEDHLARLTDPDRHGVKALRLDEVELLLAMAQRRLQIAGDLAAARRAYALAADALEAIDDPAYLDLRQTLAKERAALDALGSDPRAQALAALDAVARRLAAAQEPGKDQELATDSDPDAPWWRRMLGRFIDVQPSDDAASAPEPLPAADRAAARAGLQLELSLARAAAERRDAAAWRAALQRADDWSQRLWPGSPATRQRHERLQALAAMPLSPSLASLGSTLRQLRQLRAARDVPPPRELP